jgi:hypothetical protein
MALDRHPRRRKHARHPGVTLFRIERGLITSGRLYMEEVEEAGEDIDETVRRLSGRDREG